MENYIKEDRYLKAKERVNELRGFYIHLTTYTIIIGGLAVINFAVDGLRYPWFLWAAFGWGIGLALHALRTFNVFPFFGKSWEDRKIKEFIKKDEERYNDLNRK
ncbi:2TM domain-containing protein [Sungkyunkwania multivorans]|uniref:2TM domain-containing protein n=1 Tax=Sungkyunkwania multivorans TaxID=1173618 RepID=A0ABW3CUE0_9FLAO